MDEPVVRPKQVIVLRTSFPDGRGGTFKPRLGKMAAQAAHASMKVFFDCRLPQEDRSLVVPLTDTAADWVEGLFAKVVLGVETEEDLLKVYDEAKARGIPTALVTDAGRTEFHGVPTHTAVAVGPALSHLIDEITGPHGIVPTRLL